MSKYFGYAGTYTRKTSQGIYRFSLDTEKEQLSASEVAAELGSPTYINFNENQNYLYAVAQEDGMGGINAFRVDKTTGELLPVNGQLVEGNPPCYVEAAENIVVTSNYHKGDIGLHFTNENGEVEQGHFTKHEGNGPHERQEKPHVHFSGFTPDKKYIVAADLGTDRLVTYKVADSSLQEVSTFHAKPGSGPRHIVFHPNKQVAYLLTELSTEVIVLDYNKETGEFTEKQTILAKPADFTETNDASAIHITSDGKFLYTGNRGHNSIASFKVDPESGELTFINFTPSGGEWPRDFVLDPTEKFLIASNQNTGNVVLFKRDAETGKLEQTDQMIDVPEVVCVKFLS
ncbi:lactonase family protein [Oceanobacillus sp. CFH 90083]|uniref:lactonase family protein n=1 Tax=Oceanobacillus sp. CFH 90083 TaxID=2592336 RepID=UPI00128DC498|nr:lactonase family protein [Oceanobacillus sp. CFH 90083]